MDTFSNNDYSNLIQELIKEANYMNISNRSKLAKIRDFSEILVRKILNLGSNTKLMLGDIDQYLTSISDTKFKNTLKNTITKINRATRQSHHTQQTGYTESEVQNAEELLLDLYSMLFIQFFIDIKVDLLTEPEILTRFSFLPPALRYKTWDYLYNCDFRNAQTANKLCLSMIKTYDKSYARDWLKNHQTEINAIAYPTQEEILQYKLLHEDKNNPGTCRISLDFESYDNLYDLLLDKINDARTDINEKGKWYSTFEEAKVHFVSLGPVLDDSTEELLRLQDLMEFVYIGRQEETK